MSSREVKEYLSHHHISPLLESLLTGLLFHRPEDPVGFLKSCLITTGLMGGPGGVSWDTFIHPHTKLSVTPGALSLCIVPSTAPPDLPTPFLPPSTPLLPPSASVLPSSTSFLPPARPMLPPATSFLPPARLLLPPATSFLPTATSFLPPATPLLPPATSFLPPATPLLPPTTPLVPSTTPLLPPTRPVLPSSTPVFAPSTPDIQPLTTKPQMPSKALNIPPTLSPLAALLPLPSAHEIPPRTPPTPPETTTTPPISTVTPPVTPSQPPPTHSGPLLPPPGLQSPDVASDPPSSPPRAPQTAHEHRPPPEEGGAGAPPVGDVQRKDVHSQLSIDSDSDMTESLGLQQEVDVLFPPRPRPLIVFVIGGPGSGKGSQAARLGHAFGLRSLSLDDLLRKQLLSRTSPSRKWDLVSHMMGLGELETQEDPVSELRGQLVSQREVRGFVVDGFPRDVHQALSFQDQVGSPDLVLLLLCSNETLRCRLQRRAAILGLLGDGGHALQRRLDSFNRDIVSISRYYRHLHLLAQVDADRDEDVVFADLSLLIKEKLSMNKRQGMSNH